MHGGAAVGLVIIVGLYFIPTIVAAGRHVVNAGSVFVINLLLGWTLIGWVVALAMACRTNPAAAVQTVYFSPQQLVAPVAPAPAVPPAPPAGAAGPAPGWYRDQAGATRWWDGRSWTDHVQKSVAAPPVFRQP